MINVQILTVFMKVREYRRNCYEQLTGRYCKVPLLFWFRQGLQKNPQIMHLSVYVPTTTYFLKFHNHEGGIQILPELFDIKS